MKVTQFHLRIALFVLAGLLVLYGILKLGLGMNLGSLIEDNISNVVIFGAVAIFFWNRHLWNENKKLEEAEAQKEREAQSQTAEGTPGEDPAPKA